MTIAADRLSGVAARLSRELGRAFTRTGAVHTRAVAQRFKPGGAIQTRTGALRRSLGFAVLDKGINSELKLFSAGLPYARIQEEGGTIRPKNKRYLTVPLPAALTAAGVLKGGARLVPSGAKYKTADGDPTFIFRSKRGHLLVGARAKNGRTRLLYVLKPSVTLSARLGFRETFEKITLPFLEAEMRRALETAVSA